MTAVEPWLPRSALLDGGLTMLIGTLLDGWQRKWIARPGRIAASLQTAPPKPAPATEGWQTACGKVSAYYDRQTALRLGAALIGARHAPRTARSIDETLLSNLAADAGRDLLTRLASRFSASDAIERMGKSASSPSALRFAIRAANGALVELAVASGAAVTARKSLVRPKRTPSPLTSRAGAQEALQVNVSAQIGTSEITAADLRSLAVNDVLILDAALSEAPRLTVNGSLVLNSRFTLMRKGAALEICRSEEGAF